MTLREMIERIVREAFPRLGYHGFYEYRVRQRLSDIYYELQVADEALGLPDQAYITTRPGLAGSSAELVLGSTVLVGFVNGDPGRPFIAFYEAPDKPGFTPTQATIDATEQVNLAAAEAIVLRDGDVINLTGVQPGAGVVAATVTLAPAPAPRSKVRA